MEYIIHLQLFLTIFLSFQAKTYGNEFKKRKGVCTSFLDRLPVGGQFLSYHHANAMFKMPDDPNVPILMISAGSGIYSLYFGSISQYFTIHSIFRNCSIPIILAAKNVTSLAKIYSMAVSWMQKPK